jgi:hypothetical protein
MTAVEATAAQSRIALAEEAVSRLLAGIETGDASGRESLADPASDPTSADGH